MSYGMKDLMDDKNSFPSSYASTHTEKVKAAISEPLTIADPPKEAPLYLKKDDLDEEEDGNSKYNKSEEELALINKEILEARKELTQKDIKAISPRMLKSMIVFMQEHSLSLRTIGLTCTEHTNTLFWPIIEIEDGKEIVVLKCGSSGCLHRQVVTNNFKLIKKIADYYWLNNG